MSTIIFLVGNDSGKLIIDSRAIPKPLGGNNNGIIVTFPGKDNAVMWVTSDLP